jgi:hypothetical protein
MLSEGQRSAVGDRPAAGLVSVRTPRAKWVLAYDLATGEVLEEAVHDLVADPEERTPLPPSSVRTHGPTFCLSVARARNEVLGRYGVAPQPPACAFAR